ncbi:tetratricopeptide repeat protein [Actinomadura rupiterrae]|uniref:tetratricopeptide repeat protein n=1 Tax=Actinomadura rupiterrae TaxID=559627 RepID=UPI0020A27BBC|nr:hypothetical protein [Actinomadura rupiterrae]MCP2338627.1 hypothetical protein [Actinomadura rupiterrae]
MDQAGVREVAGLLGGYVRAAQVSPAGRVEPAFLEVRGRYEALLDDAPVTAMLGLTVLHSVKLLAYVVHGTERRSRFLREWEVGRLGPLEELPDPRKGDDPVVRELALEVVRWERRALELEPDENLAAFLIGHALYRLGDDAGARAAWVEALRVDPGDHVVAGLVAGLDGRPVPEAVASDVCRCAHGFFVFRHNTVASHSGERAETCWVVNDLAEVRQVVDAWVADYPWGDVLDEELLGDDAEGFEDYWDPESDSFDPLPDDELRVEVHTPGEPVSVRHVDRALRLGTDDSVRLDWTEVPLPERVAKPLPAGRAVRFDGRWYLYGENFHQL